MSAGRKTINERLGDLFRRLGSNHDGEIVATVKALLRVMKASDLDFHDLANRVEKANGGKLSEAEMQKIFDAGVEAGIRKAEVAQLGDGEFHTVDGTPPWEDVTVWLQHYDDRHNRLSGRERDFVDDMAGSVLWREPTERQARWLLTLFRRAGGRIR
jgi:hypothetical protein